MRRRGGRKRALGTRRPMLVLDRANVRWSLDFLSETISDGRRFRVLAIVDDYTCERAWRGWAHRAHAVYGRLARTPIAVSGMKGRAEQGRGPPRSGASRLCPPTGALLGSNSGEPGPSGLGLSPDSHDHEPPHVAMIGERNRPASAFIDQEQRKATGGCEPRNPEIVRDQRNRWCRSLYLADMVGGSVGRARRNSK